jgi:hypothetical protein
MALTLLFSSFSEAKSMTMIKVDAPLSKGDFVPIVVAKEIKPTQTTSQHAAASKEPKEDVIASKIFPCPVDGCIKLYQRYSNLESHVLHGECQLVEEKLNLFDKAKVCYREKLLHGSTSVPSLISNTFASPPSSDSLSKGWALKTGKQAKRFSEKQKTYLDQKFNVGQETGHKVDGITVSQNMRYAKDVNGDHLFDVAEFLTAQQINSYFSRLSAKLKKGQLSLQSEDAVFEIQGGDEDTLAAEEEYAFNTTRLKIMEECQLIHPLIYDNHNICQLTATNNLKKFNISMLRTICKYFHIDCSHVKVHRKDPYIVLLKDIVKMCSCTRKG